MWFAVRITVLITYFAFLVCLTRVMISFQRIGVNTDGQGETFSVLYLIERWLTFCACSAILLSMGTPFATLGWRIGFGCLIVRIVLSPIGWFLRRFEAHRPQQGE